jgi:hypothetical protein
MRRVSSAYALNRMSIRVDEDVTALAPTVPDVPNSGIRFLAREFR